ncbi:hypothetical protein Tco_0393308 [Tanacetum coccineum]
MGEGSAIPIDPHHTPTFIQLSPQPQKTQKPRRPKKKDTQVPQSNVSSDSVTGGGPKRQETMGDTIAQTRSENVSKLSNDPLLARVLDLEQTKTTQAKEIVGSSRRVESSDEEGLGEEDASKQGRIADIDANAGINLVSTHFDADTDMFRVHELVGDEVVVEIEVAIKADEKRNIIDVAKLKSAKPKADKVVIQEPEHGTTTTTPTKIIHVPKPPHDKDKGIMVEEHVVEQQRRKHFVAKRAEEKRNKPPTRAHQRSIMCTYLKNMEGWKPKSLKNKSFANIQELFDKAMKRVNTFVDYRTELVEESSKKAETKLEENLKKAEAEVMEGSSKRAGTELEQEVTKKQKIKELIEIVSDEEEVAIDVIPLAVKSPSIVDWKIHKEGKKNYYQIIRADGSSKMYLVFSHMLKSFDREDLETFYKLVKAKYGSTRPVEDLDLVLYGDLKIMFEPHVEERVWRNQQDYRVLDWKIYDFCKVHSLRMQHMHIHMLVEKRYPFTPVTITDMLNKKLQCDHFSKMGRIVRIKRHLDDLRVIVAQLKEFDLLKWDPTRGTMARVDVNTLTMEQYLALSRENQASGMGPVPRMRPAEALTAIQTMADHSHKWNDDTTSRNIESSSSKDGLAALVKSLLGSHKWIRTKKLRSLEDIRQKSSSFQRVIM